MLYNPKDYRTNRKAVLMLREKVFTETVTTADAIAMWVTKKQLAKWVKEGKLKKISHGGTNRYNKDRLKTLILESLK